MSEYSHLAPLSKQQRSQLVQAAQSVANRAYAPYSHFQVGAAVLTETGQIFGGCNVENASYGLAICAERAAIFAAIAQEGGANFQIRAIAVVHANRLPLSPCGACRQVIAEFGPDAEVIFSTAEGEISVSMTELLPHSFRLDPL
ncbi:MAG: cytidine deaminase [Aphanocapsa sp. GSE-SYN-MK-11-07L]|jgi:cytidine deaminase|nr:cytidine deaminase [Aphanocapsa sp. GSE-SYN-MK-11-07L]